MRQTDTLTRSSVVVLAFGPRLESFYELDLQTQWKTVPRGSYTRVIKCRHGSHFLTILTITVFSQSEVLILLKQSAMVRKQGSLKFMNTLSPYALTPKKSSCLTETSIYSLKIPFFSFTAEKYSNVCVG